MEKLIKNIDYVIPLITLVLIMMGLVLIGSATHVNEGSFWNNIFLQKQLIATLVGSIAIGIILVFDYRILQDYVNVIYGGIVLVLVGILFVAQTIQGGQSWIRLGPFSFQPSEITKIAVIITLADVLTKRKRRIKYILGLIVPGIYIGVPFILILLQNDLGTSLVLLAIFIGMIYVAGANSKFLFGSIFGVIAVTASWVSAHLYLGVPIPLQRYQLNRFLVLVNPQFDPLGAGYNVIQSKVAIGSGGIFGKGLFAGTQNQLNFLPERHTDFIFSVLGEEFGLIGTMVVLVCYFILIWRGITVAKNAKDSFGRFLVIGVLCMYIFHIVENVGMTLGIMPVTGIPLPFISYGGSAMVTNLIGIGLILNVNMRRKKLSF
ncbi:rod shape-determining protein RodA [Halobacteroides halobius DSM 5150]|uniref:Peptidoglycan glycosyltransferase RodA n=1 Tax=Halobacteroides halobius (strain ATCC 35273 / DSM 5150 / MD-1) TaxID=748449 RepID=L0K9D0_HALHC|nr:rod shape-determining protein RodA [Halobacteroides halobius]AGB41887.1 rod shape-determining protein RodA [Halobacteroides halobius DSM 5150]